MEVFENNVYFGGGGGGDQNEGIPNCIQAYKIPPAGETILKDKPIFELTTGVAVANYMVLAKDVSLSTLLLTLSFFSRAQIYLQSVFQRTLHSSKSITPAS